MSTKVEANVAKIVEDLKKNPSARYSKSDFQALVYAVLADKDFKAKKYVLKNDALTEELWSINGAMAKFMDKLLKHAGMNDSGERAAIIDSFEYGVRDVEWVSDAIDEAIWQYTECGKNMKLFREKMILLAVKKITRTGAHAGAVGYKKAVLDRAAAVAKRKAK